MSFSPLYGFNLNEDTINKYLAPSTALAVGMIVAVTPSTGVVAVTNDYGYFTLETVTADGPSYEERIAGLKQWEIKIDSNIPLLIPGNGKIVRTSNLSTVTGNATLEQILNISGGMYLTASGAGAASVKGVIVATPTETGITGVYDVKIRNANGAV